MLSHLTQAQYHYSLSPQLLWSGQRVIIKNTAYFLTYPVILQRPLLQVHQDSFLSKTIAFLDFLKVECWTLVFQKYFYLWNYKFNHLWSEAHHRVPTKNPPLIFLQKVFSFSSAFCFALQHTFQQPSLILGLGFCRYGNLSNPLAGPMAYFFHNQPFGGCKDLFQLSKNNSTICCFQLVVDVRSLATLASIASASKRFLPITVFRQKTEL